MNIKETPRLANIHILVLGAFGTRYFPSKHGGPLQFMFHFDRVLQKGQICAVFALCKQSIKIYFDI
jgi:hypothetical protein